MILLRDGKHLIGTIRSFDQYSNIVLEDTSERFVYGKKYEHKHKNSPYISSNILSI